MCLAMPYEVLEVKENSWAEIGVAGERHKVSLQLFPKVVVGDWVLVNLGFAVAKIEEDEAREIMQLYKDMAEVQVLQDIPLDKINKEG